MAALADRNSMPASHSLNRHKKKKEIMLIHDPLFIPDLKEMTKGAVDKA
jgi:hypothetical protein